MGSNGGVTSQCKSLHATESFCLFAQLFKPTQHNPSLANTYLLSLGDWGSRVQISALRPVNLYSLQRPIQTSASRTSAPACASAQVQLVPPSANQNHL